MRRRGRRPSAPGLRRCSGRRADAQGVARSHRLGRALPPDRGRKCSPTTVSAWPRSSPTISSSRCFPALLFLLAIISFIPIENLMEAITHDPGAGRAERRAQPHSGADPQDRAGQGRRAAHPRHARHDLEHLVGHDGDHRHAEPGLRHPRRPSVVEGPADRCRSDRGACRLHRRLHRAGRGGAGDCRQGGGLVPSRDGVRLDVEDPSVAGRLRARVGRDCHHLLLRARRRAGVDLDHARLDPGDAPVAAGFAGVPLLRHELRRPIRNRTARSAA